MKNELYVSLISKNGQPYLGIHKQRTTNKEQRTKNNEQRTKNKEQRTKKEQITTCE